MKYIMLKLSDERLVPVIFPNSLIHSEMANAVQSMLLQVHELTCEPVSAGDIQFSDVFCSGKSSTLKLDSRPSDAELIEGYDYNHGIDDEFMNSFIKLTMYKARIEAQKEGFDEGV